MRLALSAAVIASTISVGTAFAPSAAPVKGAWGIAAQQRTSSPVVPLLSTIEAADTAAATVVDKEDLNHGSVDAPSSPSASVPAVTGAEIKSRLEKQLAKLRQKDSKSRQLSKEVSEKNIAILTHYRFVRLGLLSLCILRCSRCVGAIIGAERRLAFFLKLSLIYFFTLGNLGDQSCFRRRACYHRQQTCRGT